jgi:NAD+ kinase
MSEKDGSTPVTDTLPTRENGSADFPSAGAEDARHGAPRRVGVVVHPTRPVEAALETLRDWTRSHEVELVQVYAGERQPRVAPYGRMNRCDLVAAIGGDGTTLRALHAAATSHTPVIGVAYGSLGVLTSVPATELVTALDRFAAGEWRPRRLPGLTVVTAQGQRSQAINDLVLLRGGGTQLIVHVFVEDQLYCRLAGDGVIVATPLGSSAYSMAAGGSIVVEGTKAFLCTPLAMHGGCAPPIVVPSDRELRLDVVQGFGGFQLDIDGHRLKTPANSFTVRCLDDYVTMVAFSDQPTDLRDLRQRGLIADSPRVAARAGETTPLPRSIERP